MDNEIDQIESHVSATPPGCLLAFRVLPAVSRRPPNNSFSTTWDLACRCGCENGNLLGHPLGALNPNYGGGLFVSPLAFKCASCQQMSEILDTKVHGYHAEVAKIEGGTGSVKFRGSGDRKTFTCSNCANSRFKITVGFVYWDFDMILDEPGLAAENFFNEFLMYCLCADCGHVSQPTELGKL
jgi:hypothetical protein